MSTSSTVKPSRRNRGRRRRAAVSLSPGPGGLVLNRHETLTLSGGGTGHTSNIIALHPSQFAGSRGISRSYTEYFIARFSVRLTAGVSSTTVGFKYAAFNFIDPTLLADTITDISTFPAYRLNTLHGADLTTRLPRNANQQRFYPLPRANLTPDQLADPNVVQAWLLWGTENANNSGSAPIAVTISYKIIFKGGVSGIENPPAFSGSLAARLVSLHETQPIIYDLPSDDEDVDEPDFSGILASS